MAIGTLVLRADDHSTGSKVVSEEFFGGNFLFDRDRVGEDGTFDDKAAALDIDFIRYPGGAIAEESFSLRWPDRVQDPHLGGKELVPLSDFISYASDIGAEYSLVVPTKVYMHALHKGTMSGAEVRAEIRQFVERLADGKFGDKLPKIVEIGNEYYTFEGVSDLVEANLYARVGKMFSEEIRGVLGSDVEIGVQGGLSTSTNDIIAEKFKDAGHLVDKVIYHSYPWTLDAIWGYQNHRDKLAEKWLSMGVAEGVFLSEYNLSNQHKRWNGDVLDEKFIETGMAKAVALVEMTATMIGAGVDFATVWPIQQNTNGDLGGDEGETDSSKLTDLGLTLSGAAYKMMSERLVGKTLVASERWDIDGDAENARYQKEILTHVFEDEDEVIIFASAWDLKAFQLGYEIDLDIDGDFSSVEITRLYTDGAVYRTNSPPIVESSEFKIRSLNDVSLTLEAQYEVVRLVLKKKQFEDGDSDDNRIVGTDEHDLIFGAEGDDTMIGEAGRDTIEGEDDNDLLVGKAGADILLGQHGDDELLGGTGRDKMFGGDGDDHLKGHSGADRLFGGTGADQLTGGEANDRLFGAAGQDSIYAGSHDDFANGGMDDDHLYGGWGADTLWGSAGDDFVAGGEGADRLIGGGGADLLLGGNAADKLFGGYGDDAIDGGNGGDFLHGGAGRDLLQGLEGDDTIVTGRGNDIARGGAGNDLISSLYGNDDLLGGDGSDVFHFNADVGVRRVRIDDFDSDQDQIAIEGSDLTEDSIVFSANSSGETVVEFGETKLVLNGVRSEEVDITNFRLLKPGEVLAGSDAQLERGVVSDAVIGHKYSGAKAEDGRASVSFISDGDGVSLSFRSFDIDVLNEVEILLNGRHFGFLDETGNERFGRQSIEIDVDELAPGENTITFVEVVNGVTTWGIDDLMLA